MYLFAYGTLQPNSGSPLFEEHDLGRFLHPVTKGHVRGDLLHIRNHKLQMDYPGLVRIGKSKSNVTGTVFEVLEPQIVFPIIDEHEGYHVGLVDKESRSRNYYERISVEIEASPSSKKITSFVYVLNKESDYFKSDFIEEKGVVHSGDWLRHLSLMQKEKS